MTNISTTCKGCVFEIPGAGGCTLGRLDKFRERGAQIQIEERDGEKTHLIKGRVCMMSRNRASSWASVYKPSEWATQARDEVRVRMHAIIIVNTEDTDATIIETAQALALQTLPLVGVHFVIRNGAFKRTAHVRKLLESIPKLKWSIVTMLDTEINGAPPWFGRCIDEAIKRLNPTTCQYYVVVLPGKPIPKNMVEIVDRMLNDELRQFVMLTPQSGEFHQLVVSLAAHQKVGGFSLAERDDPNSESGTLPCHHVWMKLAIIADEEGQQDFIDSWPTTSQS